MKKKKVVISVIAIVATILIIGGATYAYWQLTKTQQDSNDIVAACLSLDLEDEIGNYGLENAWPMSDDDAIDTLTGYTFSVTNNCDYDILYEIGFDSLSMDNVNYLNTNYLKVRLDEKNPGIYGGLNDVTDIDRPNARASKVLGGTTVEAGGSNTHNVKVWLDFNAPTSEINTYFKGLVFITAGQKTTEINDRILIASGDISRTMTCLTEGHNSFFEQCTQESGNNVRYEYYDNGDFIISGTGDPKAEYYKEGTIEAKPLVKTIHDEILQDKLTDSEKELLESGWENDLQAMLKIYDSCMLDSSSYPSECTLISSFDGKYDPELWKVVARTENMEVINNIISLLKKIESLPLKNIIVEEGITSLSERMFAWLDIESISLPNSLTTIKGYALESIDLNNGNLIFPSGVIRAHENGYSPWLNTISGNILEYKGAVQGNINNDNKYEFFLNSSNFNTIKFSNASTFEILSIRLDTSNHEVDIYIPEAVNNVIILAENSGIMENVNLKFYGPERELNECPTNVKSITWNIENEE